MLKTLKETSLGAGCITGAIEYYFLSDLRPSNAIQDAFVTL